MIVECVQNIGPLPITTSVCECNLPGAIAVVQRAVPLSPYTLRKRKIRWLTVGSGVRLKVKARRVKSLWGIILAQS